MIPCHAGYARMHLYACYAVRLLSKNTYICSWFKYKSVGDCLVILRWENLDRNYFNYLILSERMFAYQLVQSSNVKTDKEGPVINNKLKNVRCNLTFSPMLAKRSLATSDSPVIGDRLY